jgi:hypothetical protein
VRASVLHRAGQEQHTFSIEPVGDQGMHVVYRHLDVLPHGRHCGNTKENAHRLLLEEAFPHDREHVERMLLLSATKTMGVTVANDYQRFLQVCNMHIHMLVNADDIHLL